MKRMTILAAAIALAVGAPAAHAQRMTDEERRELETRMAELRRQMADLQRQMAEVQRQLGQAATAYGLFGNDGRPFIWTGQIDRPRLGVVVATGRRPETDSIGAVLQAVTPDGPAHDAGLRAGDIIMRFRGEALANARPYPGDRLIELAREMEEGDSIAVTYRRESNTRTATIVPEVLDDFAYSVIRPSTLTPLMEGARIMADSAMRVRAWAADSLGRVLRALQGDVHISFGLGDRWSDMELVELNPELGEYFGTTEGLLVVKAPRDSLLELRSGDVILRIGGRVPSSPSHAARILRSYEPGDEIRLEVMRQKRRQELRAVVPQEERGPGSARY